MFGNDIELSNLRTLVVNSLNKECTDDCERIRKEIITRLNVTGNFFGVIAYSELYTTAIEIYKVSDANCAKSVSYLHLRIRENGTIFFSFSNSLDKLGINNEILYTNCSDVANEIIKRIYSIF